MSRLNGCWPPLNDRSRTCPFNGLIPQPIVTEKSAKGLARDINLKRRSKFRRKHGRTRKERAGGCGVIATGALMAADRSPECRDGS